MTKWVGVYKLIRRGSKKRFYFNPCSFWADGDQLMALIVQSDHDHVYKIFKILRSRFADVRTNSFTLDSLIDIDPYTWTPIIRFLYISRTHTLFKYHRSNILGKIYQFEDGSSYELSIDIFLLTNHLFVKLSSHELQTIFI